MLAAEISIESLDTANLQPMAETALRELERAASPTHPGSCWPTPATGRTTRSRHSTARASRRSSRRTPTDAKSPGPGAAAGAMTSPAGSWRPAGARSSICDAKASPSPSSARSSQPRREPVPAPRQISGQIRMAAAGGDSQPAQASPPPTRDRPTGDEPPRPRSSRRRWIDFGTPAATAGASAQLLRHAPWNAGARARVLGLPNRYCSADHSATLAQSTSCNACVTRTERFGRLG